MLCFPLFVLIFNQTPGSEFDYTRTQTQSFHQQLIDFFDLALFGLYFRFIIPFFSFEQDGELMIQINTYTHAHNQTNTHAPIEKSDA